MHEIEKFASQFVDQHPKTVAKAFEKFPVEESYSFLKRLSEHQQISLIRKIEPGLSSSILNLFSDDSCQRILRGLSPKAIAKIVQTQSPDGKKSLLNKLPKHLKEKVEKQREFVPETAGYYMDSSVVPIDYLNTITEAFEILKLRKSFSYYLYFVDESNKLVGAASLRQLLIEANQNKPCKDIMEAPVEALRVDHDKYEILEHPLWKKYSSVPVVDYQGHFKGVINYEIFNKMRMKREDLLSRSSAGATGKALGELYQMGLSALFESASSLPEMRKKDE